MFSMRWIKRWWNSAVFGGTEDLLSHDPQRRITIGVNLMSLWIGILNITVGGFVWLITGKTSVLLAVFTETALLAMPLVLNRYSRYNGAALSIYLPMSLAPLYFGCALGNAVNSPLMIA